MKFTDIAPEVVVEAPEVTDQLATLHLRRAAITFCRESTVWRDALEPITPRTDIPEYDLVPPRGTQIGHIRVATHNEVNLPLFTEEELDYRLSGWREDTGDGVSAIVAVRPDRIRLYPVPTAQGDPITVYVVLAPAQDATSVPDWLDEKYRDDLVHGALSRILPLPGKPWTDGQAAQYHLRQFRNGISRARGDAMRSHSDRSLRVKPQNFGRSRSAKRGVWTY